MSRETNSTLVRCNINTFWSNSISSSRSLYLKYQYNCFINLYLKNHFFHPLKIQYEKNTIKVYIFFYKNEKLSFLEKFITWKKILLNKINMRKRYNIKLDLSKKNKKIKTIRKLFFVLLVKNILSKLFYKILYNKYMKAFLLHLCIHSFYYQKQIKKGSFLQKKKIIHFSKKRKISFLLKKKFKLKKLNNLLKLKYLSLNGSNIINIYYKQSHKIIFLPALKKITCSSLPFYFKYIKSDLLKKKLYIITNSFVFLNGMLLNIYISDIIKKTKNKKHIKNLLIFFKLIEIFFEKQMIPFVGFKFFISGRLNGKLRKGSFGFKLGSLKLASFKTNVNYTYDVVHTQYGCFSLKLWLCSSINN